jgi:hypothetical protein
MGISFLWGWGGAAILGQQRAVNEAVLRAVPAKNARQNRLLRLGETTGRRERTAV